MKGYHVTRADKKLIDIQQDVELDAELDEYESDTLVQYGMPRRSGRYPWGSGEDPYQHTTFGSKVRHPGKGTGTAKEGSELDIPEGADEATRKKLFEEWTKTYSPYQRSKAFHALYNELHNKGITDKEMSEAWGISINAIKAKRAISSEQERTESIAQAVRLRNQGLGFTAIAQKMGLDKSQESKVRAWLKKADEDSRPTYLKTAERLEDIMKEKGGYLDVSKGTELEMGITDNHLNIATEILKEKGYGVYTIPIKQVTNPGQYTNTTVIAPKGVTKNDIYHNIDKINSVQDYDPDDSYTPLEYPKAIDRNRVAVRYDEEGGTERDGMIFIRPGNADLSLGSSAYAQVRILVKDCDISPESQAAGEKTTRYIKGMAVYSNDAFKDQPDGIDIIVNSNKSIKKGDEAAFKNIKSDVDIDKVFGAKVKKDGQYHYVDDDGNDQLGLINKVNEEGDWERWSKSLPTQFLSKQPEALIKKQLDITYADFVDEYDTIKNLTNPVVRQKELEQFASTCDTNSVDLAAAALPHQQSHVLIPVPSMKDNEIYAPNYKDGQEVILVRYPHEGIYQIPRLKVNNKNKEAIEILGKAPVDAVAINQHVASILSGADFDGDTVSVIPVNDRVKIKNKEPIPELQNFDPSACYPLPPGKKPISKGHQQTLMGVVSNLITDMTLQGAPDDELVRATKHAMCVIDSVKHKLDVNQSYKENGIEELKQKWQMHADGTYGGASTLISRASASTHINEREIAKFDEDGTSHKAYKPNADTGEWEYRETGRTILKPVMVKDKVTGEKVKKLDADGNVVYKEVKVTQKSTKMADVKDAHELSSGTMKEEMYADYANKLKAMANDARREALAVEMPKKNPLAEAKYINEVQSLNNKLEESMKNAPRERRAQIIANVSMREILANNPGMEKDDIKKTSQAQLNKARAKVGANKKKVAIDISDKEWEAIQNNAISPSKLRSILDNTDSARLKKLAMPKKEGNALTTAQQNRLMTMINSGNYTTQEIAERMGVSTSTIAQYKKGGN